jgi:hypothetical protein
MTLHVVWLHALRWPARAHVSRAMTLMLGVVGVSLLFGALRVLDVAVSGALVQKHALVVAPSASGAPMSPDLLVGAEPTGSGPAAVDASLVEVPEATVEAISL